MGTIRGERLVRGGKSIDADENPVSTVGLNMEAAVTVGKSDDDPPAAVDGLCFAGVILGDGAGGDLFGGGRGQLVQARMKILVVGGENDDAVFPHQADDGRK